jgi:hypothetical protein
MHNFLLSTYFPHVDNRKVKVKLSLCFFLTKHHAMEAYSRSGGKAPRILGLGTRWILVVTFMLRLLCPQGKSLWYSLHRRLDGHQSRFGHGSEINSQLLTGLEPLIIQPAVQRYTAELSRLLRGQQ